MKTLLTSTLLHILLCLGTVAVAQDIETLTQELGALQDLRHAHYYDSSRTRIFDAFEAKVVELMNHPEFCERGLQKADSLRALPEQSQNEEGVYYAYSFMNNIAQASIDDKLRVLSWDDLNGGSGHSYTNYIQYKTRDGRCHTMPFDTTDRIIEVGYYDIDVMTVNKKTIYVLMGYGTYGGGLEHRAVRFYEIRDEGLIERKGLYPNGQELVVTCNRSQEPNLQFNSKKKRIDYVEFIANEESGHYSMRSKKISLKYKSGTLVYCEK